MHIGVYIYLWSVSNRLGGEFFLRAAGFFRGETSIMVHYTYVVYVYRCKGELKGAGTGHFFLLLSIVFVTFPGTSTQTRRTHAHTHASTVRRLFPLLYVLYVNASACELSGGGCESYMASPRPRSGV